jgi:acyl carrier protein
LLDALADGLAALQRDKFVPSDFSAAHVTWATPLDDLGLDSVARVALMTFLEEHLELVLEQGRFEAAETVGDIIEGILDARTVS